MRMYWAVVLSKKLEEVEGNKPRKEFFATIEETQYDALLKIEKYFCERNRAWKILKIKCEEVSELTPTNFGFIKLIP